jgi:methylglutaconyl-CoA hydratase
MSEFEYDTLTVEHRGDTARVLLDRPEVRNAFNEQMISDVRDAFERLGADDSLRAIVLAGAGGIFCAGADIAWMRRSADRTEKENVEDARAMAAMYRAVDECRVPVIGDVRKAAFGGALGLVAACDVVVAASGTKFAFSEVKLGIIPAVISVLVIPKIGPSQARRYMVTGEVFTAETAPAGLLHEVVPVDAIDAKVDEMVATLRMNGPQASREAKRLVADVWATPRYQAIDECARWISRIRVGEEAQEGLRAFLEKRDPAWRAASGAETGKKDAGAKPRGK